MSSEDYSYPVAAFASSSKTLVAATGSTLHLHDPSSSTTVTASPDPNVNSLIKHIAISPSGTRIATVTDDKQLRTYSTDPLEILSTRNVSKKCADLQFSSEEEILYADKVGDIYLYPFAPRKQSQTVIDVAIYSDPTKNPDADLLLGHVSILTSMVRTQDGKYIISSDRDEHIRISRFPESYVIDKYLFGSDGFVSALHIPESQPDILLSAGGEQVMRIWDWKRGELLGTVDIWEAMLPYRKVRSNYRKDKRKRKRDEIEVQNQVDESKDDKEFYNAPEGWMLPSGEGICIKKIQSLQIGEETIILFYSEGAAAIHSFTISPSKSPLNGEIQTLPLSHPVLDFTFLPEMPNQILISLDTAWGILRQNPGTKSDSMAIPSPSLSPESSAIIKSNLVVAEITSSGMTLIPDHPIINSLQNSISSTPTISAKTLAELQLYPLLPVLPRWIGMEEDDQLAGPSNEIVKGPKTDAALDDNPDEGDEEVDRQLKAGKKTFSNEELERLSQKALGRLKAQGIDVSGYLKKQVPRGKKNKENRKKRRLQTGRSRKGEEGGEDGETEGGGNEEEALAADP